MGWKDEHEEQYGDLGDSGWKDGEDTGSDTGGRMEKAEALLEEADRRGLYVYLNDDGQASVIALDPRPGSMVEESFLQTLGEYSEDLAELVQGRRRDGRLNGTMVVFTDDVRAVKDNGRVSLRYQEGTIRILEDSLADHLVELGIAMEHPGPEV